MTRYKRVTNSLAAILFGFWIALGIANVQANEVTSFWVKGTTLYMDGEINSDTPDQLLDMLEDYPRVKEIVLLDVPGSSDDEANQIAAQIVREAKLNTRLLSNSEIASGGTDFFIAGTNRYAAPGARVGVHSWADTDGNQGRDLPRNHEFHQFYLEFYRDMGVPEEFYWFTLKAADAENIYWMSRREIRKFNIITR